MNYALAYYPDTVRDGAPSSVDILTVAQLKLALRIEDDAEDPRLQLILASAVARVEAATGVPTRVSGVIAEFGDFASPQRVLSWEQVETLSIDSVTDAEGTALAHIAQMRDLGRYTISLSETLCGEGTKAIVKGTVGLQDGQRLDLFRAAVTAASIAEYEHPSAGQTERVFSNPNYIRALSLLRNSRV